MSRNFFSRAYRSVVVFAVAVACSASVGPSLAQTNGTWTSTTGGTWGDSANWSGGIASGTGAVADFSLLNITGMQTVTLDAPRTSGTLLFGDTTGANGGWTLTSSTLTLATASGVPQISVTGLGVSPTAALSGTSVTISSVIAGTNGLSKTGSSALILSSANTYSGTTTVSGGYLVLNDASALGNTSGVNVSGNSGVALGSGITVSGKAITVGSGGANSDGGLTAISGGTGTWMGPVTTGGGRVGYQFSSLVLSGSIGGGNALIVSGFGNDPRTSGSSQFGVTISGTTNTFSGGVQIIRGFLKLGADNALPTSSTLNVQSVANSSNSATFDLNGFNQTVGGIFSNGILDGTGAIIGDATGFITNNSASVKTFTVNQATSGTMAQILTGNLAFTKGGAGNLVMRPVLVTDVNTGTTGTNTFSGDTLVSAGTLTLGNATALFGSTFDTSGSGTLSFGTQTAATFGGLKNSGTLSLQNDSAAAVALSVGGNNVSSTFPGRLTGAGSLTKVGSGTVTLSGNASDYAGTTTISAGTLLLTNSAAIPGIVTGGRYSVAANATLATGTAFDDATLQSMVGTGNFAANSILGVDTGAGDRTFASSLTGTVGMAITGANALTLSASNTLGPVSVTGATLKLASTSALAGSGTITVNGGTVEWNPSTPANYSFNSRNILVTGSGGTFRSVPDGQQTVFGNISGTGAVVFASGSGTIVTNGNSYTGGTTIKPGAFIAYTSSSGFGSGPLTIEGGSIRSSQGTPQTLSMPVTLAGNVTFNASGSAVDNNLVFTGSMTITGATRTVDVSMSPRAGATGIFFNGPIGEGTSGLGLVKTGTSMLILGGANTYTGTTTIAAGTLRLDNASALDGGGNLTFSGGVLQYSGSNQVDYSSRIVASGSVIAIDTNGQGVSFANAIAATNSGGLTKSGSGTLTLAANSAYTGLTTVSGGTLQIGTGGAAGSITGNLTLTNTAAVVFNRSDNVVFGNVISGTGRLQKSGAGTLTLSGSSNALTGSIAILGGALVTTNAASLTTVPLTTYAYTIDSGTLMSAASAPANGFSATFASLAIGSGGATIRSDQRVDVQGVISGSSPTASLTYGTTTGTVSGVTMVISGNNTYAGGTKLESRVDLIVDNNTAFGTGTLELAGARMRARSGPPRSLANAVTISASTEFFGASSEPSLTFTGTTLLSGGTRVLQVNNVITSGTSAGQPGVIFTNSIGDGGNGFGITKSGSGVLALAGANTYSGTTTFADGTLRLDNADALGGGGNLTFTGGTLLYTSANTADYSSRIKGSTGAIRIDPNGQSITYAGSVDSTNSGGLRLGGSGTLTLSGSNGFTGTTQLAAGVLALANSGALAGSGTVAFNGGSVRYLPGGAGADISGRIRGSNSAILIDTNGENVTFASAINNTNLGGLTKSGAGTLTLSGSNSYAGTTSVTGGTLAFTSESVWTSVSGTVALDGATFAFTGAAVGNQSVGQPIVLGAGGGTIRNIGANFLSLGGLVSGSGPLTVASGSNLIVLGGANTNSGGVTLEAGSLVVVSNDSTGPAGAPTSSAFGTGTLALAGGSLRATTGAARTVGNAVIASADTTFATAGTNTDKSLTFTGPVTLSGGSRTFTVDTTGTGSPAIVFSGAIGDGGNTLGLTKAGPGRMILAGNNTYAGPTTVSVGTLVVNGDQSAATGIVTVAGGATLMGSGTIGGDTSISGFHSPGTSPGVQTFGGNLAYVGGTSTVLWELWGNTETQGSPTAFFDQVIVSGTLDFAGLTTLSLSFNDAGSTVNWTNAFWDSSRTWILYDVSGTTTNYANLVLAGDPTTWLDTQSTPQSLAAVRPDSSFTIMQSGNDVLVVYAAVPEPATLGIAGVGVVVLVAVRAWKSARSRNTGRRV